MLYCSSSWLPGEKTTTPLSCLSRKALFGSDVLQIELLLRDGAAGQTFVWINASWRSHSESSHQFFLLLLFSADGQVYTWGKGARGRLGRKEEECGTPKPIQLEESRSMAVTSVACCHGNTLLAVKRNILLITIC